MKHEEAKPGEGRERAFVFFVLFPAEKLQDVPFRGLRVSK